MKKLIIYALMFLMVGSFTACNHGVIGTQSLDESHTIKETQIAYETEVIDEVETVQPKQIDKPIEEVETQAVFMNPLEGVAADMVPEHIQLTVGEDITTSFFVTLILDENVTMPSLVLVDAAHRLVEVVEGVDVTAEDVTTAGLKAYSYALDHLIANYSYQYAFKSGDQWSEVYNIELPADHVSTRVAVFGDLQGYKLSQYMTFQSVFDAAEAHGNVDLHFLMGDIVDRGDSYDQWDFYYQAMIGRGPWALFASAIGNHDVKGSRDFYNTTFAYETNGLESLPESTGYFDLPFARVAMIDTEKPSTFEAQEEWLEQVMSTTDKPYRIVLMHRSVFPIFYVEPHMQVWAKVFEDIGIDLVFSGHDHIYSRTRVEDVTYVVTGSGSGSKFYSKSDQRSWEGYVYDEDYPVYIIMDILMDDLTLKSYGFVDGNSQLMDEMRLSETRHND